MKWWLTVGGDRCSVGRFLCAFLAGFCWSPTIVDGVVVVLNDASPIALARAVVCARTAGTIHRTLGCLRLLPLRVDPVRGTVTSGRSRFFVLRAVDSPRLRLDAPAADFHHYRIVQFQHLYVSVARRGHCRSQSCAQRPHPARTKMPVLRPD